VALTPLGGYGALDRIEATGEVWSAQKYYQGQPKSITKVSPKVFPEPLLQRIVPYAAGGGHKKRARISLREHFL